jgi:hypothetical protein
MVQIEKNKYLLIGGMSYENLGDISELQILSSYEDYTRVKWKQITYTAEERVIPLSNHSAIFHRDKIYLFAGQQMYNRKRQIREFENRV